MENLEYEPNSNKFEPKKMNSPCMGNHYLNIALRKFAMTSYYTTVDNVDV